MKGILHVGCWVNGYFDHVHSPVSLGSDQTNDKTALLIKGEASFWVYNNKCGLNSVRLEWQDDYMLFLSANLC